MFTGLIECMGKIVSAKTLADGKIFTIEAPSLLDDLKPDDSVAVNGVCLTATSLTDNGFEATAVSETLQRSNLGHLRSGALVNLERALKLGDRLGGHLVQGHVDGLGILQSVVKKGTGYHITVSLPPEIMRYAVEKGSVTLNGVSLTIAALTGHSITAAVIPYTWEHTVFQYMKSGEGINIEVDLIGKYVEKLLGKADREGGLTFDRLKSLGY